MALTVEITGGENIEQGEQVTLGTTVTEDGNPAVGTLQYAWSASRGSFVGATNEASAVYHADFTDTSNVDVTITCNVTRAANANPTSSGPSLTALAEIGVTGILVNIFMTELGAVAQNANSVLYNATTGTLDAGSDQRLSSDIFVHQIRWDNTVNNFVLNNNESGHIGNFFLNNTDQSLYLIFSDGSYLELTATDFAAGTSRGNTWARWLVTDSAILALLNGLSTTSDLVVGVADAGSIGWDADSGSDTETFTAAAVPPLTIEAIDEQSIPVLTEDYVLEIDIGGAPERAYVDGDMEGFYHEWDATNAKLRIKAIKVTRLITGAIWNVHLVRRTRTLDRQIIYNVVPSAPVITDPGAQTLYKGIDFRLMTNVANVPSVMRGSGLLTGLKYVPAQNDEGQAVIMTEGVLPRKTKLSESSFMMKQYAENDGGTDELDVPVTIKESVFLGVLTSGLVRIYDLKNNNQQFGEDISISGPYNRIAMSGSRVAVNGNRQDTGFTAVYDFIYGGQVGSVRFGRSGIVMSRRYLVGRHYSTFRTYDLENGFAQLGSQFSSSGRNQFDGVSRIAISGTLFAAHHSSSNRIRVFDLANDNQQLGSLILLGGGTWRDMVMSGSYIILLRSDSTSRIIRVFDTANSNAQVGSDISLGTTGTWEQIVVSGTRVAVRSATVVKVFDITTRQQVGSDINTGGSTPTLTMQDPLVVVRLNSGIIKVFDIDNAGQQVGSDIDVGSRSIALDSN